jgi:hypothetical protein
MSRITGLAETYALFASIPQEAKVELKDRLTRIAQQVLQAQKSAAPHETGALVNSLNISEQVQNLRATAGLQATAVAKGIDSTFYGIFQEYGVKAGEKLVQRRRRVNGKLRLKARKKRLEDIVTSYILHWKGEPARPFIHIESRVDSIIDSGMAGFWDSVLSKL